MATGVTEEDDDLSNLCMLEDDAVRRGFEEGRSEGERHEAEEAEGEAVGCARRAARGARRASRASRFVAISFTRAAFRSRSPPRGCVDRASLAKGYEVGAELGYYRGCCAAWSALLAAEDAARGAPAAAPSRAARALAGLAASVEACVEEGPDDLGVLVERLERVRAQFKAAAALLALARPVPFDLGRRAPAAVGPPRELGW